MIQSIHAIMLILSHLIKDTVWSKVSDKRMITVVFLEYQEKITVLFKKLAKEKYGLARK
jgi:hypothetical protein